MQSIVVKQCTGFKSVNYNIEFQPRTPSLGRKLVESENVLNVVEYDKCIEAKVLSQTAGQNLYDTKLWVNDTRQIIKVSCICTYRESLRCKHVYALIHYVNNDQTITKTSKSREFALEKYSKGRSCEETFPHRKRPYNSEGSHEIVKEPLPIDMSEFSKNTAVSIILTACFKDKSEVAAEATISFILDKVEEMLSLDQSEKVITPIIGKMSLLVDQNEVYSSDTESTKYGIKNEPKARKLYEKIYDCRVEEVGIICSKKHPWLGVSLDGIVIKKNSVMKPVEIKSPKSLACKKLPVVNFEQNVSNVKYLELVNKAVVLKQSDKYYTQCQIQMYVTGMDQCDLFIYSPVKNGSLNVKVYRNNNFIKKAVLKAEEFYFLHYLPQLYKTMNNENSKASSCDVIIQNHKLPKRLFTGKDLRNI